MDATRMVTSGATLHLEVTRYLGLPPAHPSTLDVGVDGASLGRNTDNSLVLVDSERMVSGLHARIDFKDASFRITDQSTNGTFLNGSTSRLTPNLSVALNDGDTLVMGPYEIAVSIETMDSDAPADPFDQGGLALPGMNQPGPGADILDLLGGEPSLASEHGSSARDDPFADAQRLDPFLSGPAPTDDGPRGAKPHLTPVEHVHFRPPDNRHPIPEDYDLLADAMLRPPPDPVPDPERESSPEFDTGPDPDLQPTDGRALPPGPGLKPNLGADLDWDHACGPLDSFDSAAPPPPAVEPEPPMAPLPQPEAPAARSPFGAAPAVREPTPDPSKPIPNDDPLAAFLAGLGTGDPAKVEDPRALLHEAGALLRALTGGLTATMMARAQFKSELRLGVTTIRRSENNPFKFSVSPDEALERLLLRPNPGFLPPLEASQEAFEDIQAHEMAMIAGLRAALRALLARFEPNALEARLGEASGLDRLLPMARKSRYWELFTETYGQVATDAAEDFMQLFGEAFARAYEDQILRLAQVRSQDPRPR